MRRLLRKKQVLDLITITRLEYSKMKIIEMCHRDNLPIQEVIITEMNKDIMLIQEMIDLVIILEMITVEMIVEIGITEEMISGMIVEMNEEMTIGMIGEVIEETTAEKIEETTAEKIEEKIAEMIGEIEIKDLTTTPTLKTMETNESVNKDLVTIQEKNIPTKDHIKDLNKKNQNLKNRFRQLYRMAILR
jgi:hypothetical protein